MSAIIDVPVATIDSNPFRQLDKYPYVERKLETLCRSYADVGMWEGVIARKAGNRYQIAFGHHRVEAARRSGLEAVPLIVRTLSDEQMLQFMGRENMEDYNADFLCMLETWESALGFLTDMRVGTPQVIAIARLLGWTISRSDTDGEKLNHTALACNAGHALVSGGYLSLSDLSGLSVRAAHDIVERAQSRMEQLERIAKKQKTPIHETDNAKKQIARGAKETIRQSREGEITQSGLRSRVDVNTYRFAHEEKKQSPLFAMFGKILADSISRMLENDASAEKLAEVQKALQDVSLDDDKQILKRLDYELQSLGERTSIWRKRLTPADAKVTRLHSGS